MLIENVKKGQRVRLIKTVDSFGSERQAEAVLNSLGLEEAYQCDIDFWKDLERVGVEKGYEGTVVNFYTDGWVDVQFDGFDKPFDIPAHCLEEIKEEKNERN